MTSYRRSVWALALIGLLINAGCGGSSPSAPSTPAPTPVPAPVTTSLGQGTYQGPSGSTGPLPGAVVTATTAGTVTATLRWTFASNDVDLFVLSGTTCTTHANGVPTGAGCTILCRDVAGPGLASATCTFAATAGAALVWATNYGPTSESGTWIVTITR